MTTNPIPLEQLNGQSTSSSKSKRPRILFVITEDWFFVSHFLERASEAIAQGFIVAVACRVKNHAGELASAGIRVYPINFSRRGLNPLKELATAIAVRKAAVDFRPDIIHNIALKPIVTGSIGARLAGHRRILNAPVGMGYVFTSDDAQATFLRPLLKYVIGRLLRPPGTRVVVENHDDYSALISSKMVREDSVAIIRGAGVDLDRFVPTPEPGLPVVVCLIARMLKDKGVGEFVAAAKLVKATLPDTRFVLIGAPDDGNPSSFTKQQLLEWHSSGDIEWQGHRTDIPSVLSESHVAVLPSYREGLPKSLIEALAAGRPVVATDVEGCREVVTHGTNGLLVPARDSRRLAAAIETLVRDRALRLSMGAAGRQRAEKEFASPIVIRQTMQLYREMLEQ